MGARESKMLQSESSESHKTGNTRPLLILKIFWHMCRVRALCRLEPLGNNAACVGLHEQGCAKFRLNRARSGFATQECQNRVQQGCLQPKLHDWF